MNEILNKFLLTRDKFMPELRSRQPTTGAVGTVGFVNSACGQFTKHCERIQKFKETDNMLYIYKNKLDAHGAEYANSKDMAKRTISDKVSRDKAYEIARTDIDGFVEIAKESNHKPKKVWVNLEVKF